MQDLLNRGCVPIPLLLKASLCKLRGSINCGRAAELHQALPCLTSIEVAFFVSGKTAVIFAKGVPEPLLVGVVLSLPIVFEKTAKIEIGVRLAAISNQGFDGSLVLGHSTLL
ncbi:hypothetical protein WN73_38500 [Bradyrhizobium sp. CCBAU 45394]|nr:hypothetical protein [Bradyrhizobium sp. CCBAU 45394]